MIQFQYDYPQFHKMGFNITVKNEDHDFNPHPTKFSDKELGYNV